MADSCPKCSAELVSGANYCARCGASVVPSEPAEQSDTLLGSVVLGRYRVVRVLGEGGMGRVYLAEQAMGQATRPVALKTLRRELTGDPKVSGRFLRESEIVIRLDHPNTIQFYDFGRLDDGTMVIVMEYIEGRTLADELSLGPLPLARVDALMVQICGSLAEAHARGIVHRDLKPQNVLLTSRAGRDDFVKVVDFGIALRRSEDDQDPTRLTTHGTLVGTPPYMSPEQFQDRDIDARSDVYSLGVMLYRMLTGEFPFEARNTWQWAAAHIDQAPRPLTDHPVARELASHRVDAVMRALAKQPGDRPSDAGELLRVFTGAATVQAHAHGTVSDIPAAPAAVARPPDAPDTHTPSDTSWRAGRAAWFSWGPVGLLLIAGAVMSFRGAGRDSLAPPTGVSAVPDRSAPARARRSTSRPSSEAPHRGPTLAVQTAATPSASAQPDASAGAVRRGEAAVLHGGTEPSGDEARVAAVRDALESRDLHAAVAALGAAERALGPDHADLQSLRVRAAELASNELDAIAVRGDCAAATALAERISAAGLGSRAALQAAASSCQRPANSPMDAGENSPITD